MTEADVAEAAQSRQREDPSQTSLSLEAMLSLGIVDETLTCMYEVMHLMQDFKIYIQVQKDKGQPLYRWSTYNGYYAIRQAVRKLAETSGKLKRCELSKDDAMFSLRQATKLSLVVSRIAIYAMSLMSVKCDTCIDEIEASNLSEESKVRAKVTVTNELRRLIKHCTETTAQIYGTTDALRASIHTGETEKGMDLPTTLTLVRESEARATRKNWVWTVAVLLLGVTAGVSTSLIPAHLHSQDQGFASSQVIQKQQAELQRQQVTLHKQQITLREQQAAFQTLTSSKLQTIQKHQEQLAVDTQALTDRFDNLVESLGPTDDHGRYFARTEDDPILSAHDEKTLRKAIDQTRSQLKELDKKVLFMRKDFQYAEIRLEKRLNRLGH
ncbi:hypothetical protein IQ07DRAFT_22199 [Pyrenochaeta sp. DS3sAY3a]|nr:hypothetical protein IQ07DRAFT_22199 [Pyrenochaeta sp. DS3sAY3a]